ncbi:class I SAM-dependent DNA methyltransferase [Trichlorobacter lovleyi]|uniref:Methyltransferase type 11 n=1 Tax=Trichlorobacter lovleyi (strain ATCC BAA-1151 / DSM 17278 / SZ) TaxID=398767 RepID=B3EBP4_TRIL1|nr:class I SAM-dependent methyltransferase [Trichlorobacter lovleyi]ACD97083.1 Methyltransferase type 11 [Trichlorobacter lovleyi SZ]
MSLFGEYARYYDLLYRDKDYAAEVAYIHDILQQHCPAAHSILNLGCGSGRHDRLLSEKGYAMTGVDLSEDMLAAARQAAEGYAAVRYVQDDVRTVRLDMTFDVIISLFHVMSYQAENADLMAAFGTARQHLKSGGIFIFDCWYGPAVLTDRPAVRVKELVDDTISITRIASPVMHPNQNLVDVNYHLFARNLLTKEVQEVRETHRMRYLYLPELSLMLQEAGFEVVRAEEWLTARPLGFDTWNALVVCS